MEKEKIDICKSDFLESKNNLIEATKLAKDMQSDFLKVKLGFVAFVGVIFTSVVSKKDIFSDNFFIYLLAITFFAFILLLDEFFDAFKNHEKSLVSLERRTILANIRHAAAAGDGGSNKFAEYGERVEDMANTENKIVKSMQAGESIEDIIKKLKSKRGWRIDLFSWFILILLIPILFLLETWGLLSSIK